MKSTGIVRPIDELGRIVLPMELRKMMGLKPKDSLEIFADHDTIMLRKYEPTCVFCGNLGELTMWRGKLFCKNCLEELKKL